MALIEEQRNPWRAIVAGGDYNLTSQDWEDLLTELDSLYTEAPIAQPTSECQCSMTTKLVGDGCVHCNPEYTTDHEAQPASDYKKLIAQLKDPEIYFPGNFDTVKRANAMLMCLCQEAADALSASAPSEQKPRSNAGQRTKAIAGTRIRKMPNCFTTFLAIRRRLAMNSR